MLIRRFTAGMVGFVGLTLEIAYTRIVSFKLFYYYTYLVIGLALLGFGAAATVTALAPRLRHGNALDTIRRLAPVVGIVGVLSYFIVAALPTDVDKIWIGTIGQAITQLALLFVLAFSLTAVFFALGIVISVLIVVDAADVRRLYFWDLAGAALGCLVAVPLQLAIGPPAMVLISLVAFAALGVIVALRTSTKVPAAVIGLAVVVVAAVVVGQRDVRTDETKTLEAADVVTGGDWGAVFRVDAVNLGDLQVLHHDGLWGSSIWRYDGTPATTARFDHDSRQIPWATLGHDPEHLLIIGAAGGNEIQAALTYGVGQIDAVELNPVTERLVKETFADYNGHITDLPNVNYVQGDGRTYLARSDEKYDLVWFVAPDSYAASNAATAGAFVLSESYLYTEQMIQTAFDHLAPDGLIVAQFGDFDFTTRPTRTARYLVTARDAISPSIGDDTFSDHVALLVEDGEVDFNRVSTIVLSKAPLDAADNERILASLGNVPVARAVYVPGGGGTEEGITAQIITDDQADVDALVASYPFDISTITDDRPFFWHFTGFEKVATNWHRGIEDSEIAIGERLLLVLLIVAIVTALLFLAVPFLWSRRAGGAGAPIAGRWRLFVYFAALGLGFMVVEVSMIQRFALLLGYPTLSLSVSLFTLLLATAFGARYSEMLRHRTQMLPAAVGAMWVITLLYVAVSGPVTDAVLAWPQWARIGLVFVMLFPVGALLGLFLPAGIDRARAAAEATPGTDEGRLVAWCWAVNGFFSVIGSTSTTILSMTFGFNRTVIVGLLMYTVAAAVLLGWHKVGAGQATPSAVAAA